MNADVLKRTLLSLVLTFVAEGAAGAPVHVAGRPVFVAATWQQYLRLVPLGSRIPDAPILFAEGGIFSAAINHFVELFEGSPVVLDDAGIDQLVREWWPKADRVVLCGDGNQRLALMAAVIAAARDAPLFLGAVRVDLTKWGVREVILVGDVAPPSGVATFVRLPDLGSAARYLDVERPAATVAVLASDDSYSFLSALPVARHRARLLFDEHELVRARPRTLIWIGAPETVLLPNRVSALYAAARYDRHSQIYDPAIGVITGISPEDASLLLARAYYYRDLRGAWRNRVVSASVADATASRTERTGDLSATILGGAQATRATLDRALASAEYAFLGAHGGPRSLALADGSWPGPDDLPDGEHPLGNAHQLPPLVVVAEACETVDLSKTSPRQSLPLRLVSAGAVAFVGSIETGGVMVVGDRPFFNSTPDAPIGEIVRLQNAGRMAMDAVRPRGVLIGEPTFWRALPTTRVLRTAQSDVFHLHVFGQPAPEVVAVWLTAGAAPSYGEAIVNGAVRRTYTATESVGDSRLAVAVGTERTGLLLEWPGGDGELRFFTRPPAAVVARHLVGLALLGTQAVFIDVATISGAGIGWLMALAGGAMVVGSLRHRSSRALRPLFLGISTGSLVGSCAVCYVLMRGLEPVWPSIAAVTLLAAAAVWRLAPHARPLWTAVLSGIFVILPWCLPWAIVGIAAGVSAKVHVAIVLGLLLVVCVCALSFLASLAVWRLGYAIVASLTGRAQAIASSPPRG